MNGFTTKQLRRMEKKKKKVKAFLEIARLNDKDKEAKLQSQKEISVVNNVSSKLNEINMVEKDSNKQSYDIDTDNANKLACVRDKGNSETTNGLKSEANKKLRLNGEEYALLKQELREHKRRLTAIPRLILTESGEDAIIDTNVFAQRIPLFLSDVQHLLLCSLLRHYSPYLPTRWCHLEKYNRVWRLVYDSRAWLIFYKEKGRLL